MLLKISTYEMFAEEILTHNKKIIVYGAGMLGEVLAPYILHEFSLENQVEFYVDADFRKHGKTVKLYNRLVEIKPPNIISKIDEHYVLLITNSHFYSIIKQFNSFSNLENVLAYVLPLMQLKNRKKDLNENVVTISENPLIPKRINYCWFSGNPIPSHLQRCIDSWKKFCPDYEIVRWDETNFDISTNVYMKKAYEHKKWGFVPDVARLQILYENGGIYLDTDVELKRSLDDLLYVTAFVGTEKWGTVNFGGCSACVPKHSGVLEVLKNRQDEPFEYENGDLNLRTCGFYETLPFLRHGFKLNNETQIVSFNQNTGFVVYSSDFFHPADHITGLTKENKNTFSIHHFDGGWLTENDSYERKQTQENYDEILSMIIDG